MGYTLTSFSSIMYFSRETLLRKNDSKQCWLLKAETLISQPQNEFWNTLKYNPVYNVHVRIPSFHNDFLNNTFVPRGTRQVPGNIFVVLYEFSMCETLYKLFPKAFAL